MAISNNLTNSSTRKYLPPKVIPGFAQDLTPMESWLYDDGTGDPWWQGAIGSACRWIMTADVFAANHSSHLTRMPNQYTGLDVTPGMWVFSNAEPRALRVVSVISQTDSTIQCVVEDVDRYNTFTDPAGVGTGSFAPLSNIIFFELGDDGLPVLNPLPAGTDVFNVSQIEARYRVFNPTVENRFFQINHGFKEGQVLKINTTTGLFEHATSNDMYLTGTVVAVGPGPNYFYLSPSTKLIKDLEPGLPGNVGDVIWLDPTTGDRTTVPNGSMAPLYVKMTKEVPSFTIGTNDNPGSFGGTAFKINNHLITLPGSELLDTSAVISEINSSTPNHGVTAGFGSSVNTVVGTASYPMSTPTTFQFKVNNVLHTVSLPSVNFGTAGQIGWWDIIRAVNEQTTVHTVYATFDPGSGFITFTSKAGLAITFENVAPLTTSGDDKTFTDMVGVTASNPASAATKLKLVRNDGGQIIITDVSGTFTFDMGIQSAGNGQLPLALVVDKSMIANQNYIVMTIAERDAITNVRSGDQVFVQQANSANEWALYVRTGETWTKISDQDSANTDAQTLTVQVNFDSSSPISIGTLSPGSRVVDISVVVDTTFDGTAPTLSVGTMADNTLVMDEGKLDLTNVGSYETATSYINNGTSEQELFVFFTSTGSTVGSAKVIVSYL